MDLKLQNRRAAVAGASSGLGLATARALAAEGVRVAICGRDRDRVEAAAASIEGDAVAIVADMATPEGPTAFVEQAVSALGGVDILVANAGGPPAGDFAGIDDLSAYAAAFELNCLSTIAMCKAAVPAMQEQRWGRVVAITSIAVRQPIAGLILSNTARAGVTGFLKTLAREVAGDGVTVNSLQPGTHDTERIQSLYGDPAGLGASVPAGFIGDAGDFGAIAAFLCSDAAKYLTGTAIPVDGGA
ncbi:MAG: SDR family oxidoreductase, partial [Acidimicrobiales bacterium]